MPLPIKQRLQRRLAARNSAAGASTGEFLRPTGHTQDAKGLAWDNSLSEAALDAAENKCRSLVEELMPLHDNAVNRSLLAAPVKSDEFLNAPKWSLHRKLTAISHSPSHQFQRLWEEMVCKYDLRLYYDLKPSLQLTTFDKLLVEDFLLCHVFWQIDDDFDFLSIGAVCRRWHFLARCVWDYTARLALYDFGDTRTSNSASLRPLKVLYRFCFLRAVVFAGDIIINPESLTFGGGVPLVNTIAFCGVYLASNQMSAAEINDKVRHFVKEAAYLEWLVLANVYVCAMRSRADDGNRSLDFRWPLAETRSKQRPREVFPSLMLSLDAFHRHDKATFEKFVQELRRLQTVDIILCGSNMSNISVSANVSNISVGVSQEVFAHSFADLMPHLRELSLCDVVFGDGTVLQRSTLDLLAKKVRRDSNLELFCLTKGEISEGAICDLQRCAKLQVIILLRCNIISTYSDLRLMAGWHPRANEPSTLITDDVTVPRWFKPRYFRVVRIDYLSKFCEPKFAELCNRWWTVYMLLSSFSLRLPEFCLEPIPPSLGAEDIFADSCWFH